MVLKKRKNPDPTPVVENRYLIFGDVNEEAKEPEKKE